MVNGIKNRHLSCTVSQLQPDSESAALNTERPMEQKPKTKMVILPLLLMASCVVTSSLACSCMPTHPQKQFCDAHYGK